MFLSRESSCAIASNAVSAPRQTRCRPGSTKQTLSWEVRVIGLWPEQDGEVEGTAKPVRGSFAACGPKRKKIEGDGEQVDGPYPEGAYFAIALLLDS